MTENNRIKMEALACVLIFLGNVHKVLKRTADLEDVILYERGCFRVMEILGLLIFDTFDKAELIRQAEKIDADIMGLSLEKLLCQAGLKRSGE